MPARRAGATTASCCAARAARLSTTRAACGSAAFPLVSWHGLGRAWVWPLAAGPSARMQYRHTRLQCVLRLPVLLTPPPSLYHLPPSPQVIGSAQSAPTTVPPATASGASGGSRAPPHVLPRPAGCSRAGARLSSSSSSRRQETEIGVAAATSGASGATPPALTCSERCLRPGHARAVAVPCLPWRPSIMCPSGQC